MNNGNEERKEDHEIKLKFFDLDFTAIQNFFPQSRL